MDNTQRLTRAIGEAIEKHVNKRGASHLEILRSLEALRYEFTEDFVQRHPDLIWTLHKQ